MDDKCVEEDEDVEDEEEDEIDDDQEALSEAGSLGKLSPSSGTPTPIKKGGRKSGKGSSQPKRINPALQEKCNCDDLRYIRCHLETKDLWDKFHELGTEMIITKTGRLVAISALLFRTVTWFLRSQHDRMNVPQVLTSLKDIDILASS